MKNLNVAKMGSNDSKYGARRSEFEKGDKVEAGRNWQYTGVVIKATAREVIIQTDAGQVAFIPSGVRLIEDTTNSARIELARAAFYGSNDALMHSLNMIDSYEWEGIEWPANGMTLERAIELMETMTDEEMAELKALGIIK